MMILYKKINKKMRNKIGIQKNKMTRNWLKKMKKNTKNKKIQLWKK